MELDDETRAELVESYQKAYEVVTKVNELLDIDNDPLGVLCWWNTDNDETGGPPFDLIWFPNCHDLIIHAAEALAEEMEQP